MTDNSHLLEVDKVKKYFPIKKGIVKKTVGWIQAVDGVSFFVDQGEALGLVGESGSGKSTIGKCILKLYEATAGRILFNQKNLARFNSKEMKAYRKKVQAIFQDPYSSLNPRMSVANIVGEPAQIHGVVSRTGRMEYVADLLEKVGLRPEVMERYPHEFSGGQRQRIGIARALALRPELIICDEPVSALDVSIQAQVINLLDDLKEEFTLSYLFIAHDLSVVEHVCDRIAVMYLGKILEVARDTQLYANPIHPYTKALLSAVPVPDPKRKKTRMILRGEVPSPINPPPGCRFHERCPHAQERCSLEEPEMKMMTSGHCVACFYA